MKGNIFSYISCLECSSCSTTYNCDQIINVCRECGMALMVKYDIERLSKVWSKSMLDGREPSLWRYHELLPVRSQENVVSLGEGMTPLIRANNLEKYLGVDTIFIKDESQMPTCTFKSRGSSVALSRAKELGVKRVALPTNGNAGSSWACYGARGGVDVIIAMPTDATKSAVEESIAFGAKVVLVDGLINDCGKIIGEYLKTDKTCFEVSTLKEPYRLEGKKTMGFELAEQLKWKFPDVIIYPTGGGVGLIAIYKAFLELKELGWIEGNLPKFISVQAKGCSPLKEAYDKDETHCTIFEGASTVATGMRVPKSFGDFMIISIIRKTNGHFITVEEDEILEMYTDVPKREGIFLGVEGAAAVAGVKKAVDSGVIKHSDRIVIVNTGSGLKTPGVIGYPNPPILKKDGKFSIDCFDRTCEVVPF